jgi:hypothetical protein
MPISLAGIASNPLNAAQAAASQITSNPAVAAAASTFSSLTGNVSSLASSLPVSIPTGASLPTLPELPTLPSFSSLMDKAKSGGLFTDPSAQLSALSGLGVSTDGVSSVIAKAQASASTDLALAKASLAQSIKEATAAGVAVSADAIAAAKAPLGVLGGIGSQLSSGVSSISDKISNKLSALGVTPTGNPLADMQAGSAALANFQGTIPTAPTAPVQPNAATTVGGVTIPNPTYAAELASFQSGALSVFNTAQATFTSAISTFASNPANALGLGAVSNIASVAGGVTGNLSSSFSGLAGAAASAVSATMGAMKADGILSKLTKVLPTDLAGALGGGINSSVITRDAKFAIIKAQETSVTQSVPGQTPNPDPVRPSSNPPTPPVSSISKPGLDQQVWTSEVNGLADARDAAFKAFWKTYGLSYPPRADPATAQPAYMKFNDSVIPGYGDSKTAATAIRSSKPDKTTWTEAEAAAVELYESNKTKLQTLPEYIKVNGLREAGNQLIDEHKAAYNCWLNNLSRYTLPATTLQDMEYYDKDGQHSTATYAVNSASATIGSKIEKPAIPDKPYTVIAGYARKNGIFSDSFG